MSGKTLLIACLVIVLGIAALWIWKSVELNRAEKRHRAEKMELTGQWLQHLAQPYVWAIRKEIMNGNIAEVNLYGNELVRQGGFSLVLVAAPDGKIIAATDKQFEGTDITAQIPANNVGADSATIHKLNDSTLLLVSPVMGLNDRLGTLAIQYRNANH